jgi:hypothetical protein
MTESERLRQVEANLWRSADQLTRQLIPRTHLLIIDEFGYLLLATDAAAALFQVIARRYLKGSVILTMKLRIASWAGSLHTPPWPRPCSTGCRIVPWSSTSRATAIACGPSCPGREAQDEGDARRTKLDSTGPGPGAHLGSYGDQGWGDPVRVVSSCFSSNRLVATITRASSM